MSFKRDFECPTGWSDCSSCTYLKGQEEDLTPICGRRPKQFSCSKCGSKQFVLVKRTSTEVDFSREGGVGGHPFLSSAGERFDHFACSNCKAFVPYAQAQEMLKEVL